MIRITFVLLLCFTSMHAYSQSKPIAWHQVLNRYIESINQATKEAEHRLQTLKTYYQDAQQYRQKPGYGGIRLASSGALNTYYYEAARQRNGSLTTEETRTLNASLESLQQAAEALDEQCKALETYIRLEDYKQDNFRQSDALMHSLEAHFGEFRRREERLMGQIEAIYRHYQPAGADPYLRTDLAMRKALEKEKALLKSWLVYLDEAKPGEFPVALIGKNIAENEAVIASLTNLSPEIEYPASDMVKSFRSALETLQQAKRNALDAYTYQARQSARHSNQVYLNLINHFNNDLLVTYQAFVQYSATSRRLLSFSRIVPVFQVQPATSEKAARTTAKAVPFQDAPPLTFTTRRAAKPVEKATLDVLNQYVAFINESLRQVSTWQVLLRNYSSSAEYYRQTTVPRRRGNLSYSHEEVKLPVSLFAQVINSSRFIPATYRSSVQSQANVLMNMLKEMDALSIELIGYTQEKQYEQDDLHRSDEIVERYAFLVGLYDQKKEALYHDIRRIYESYPVVNSSDAWYVSGMAMLEVLDLDKEVLFGVRRYLGGQENTLPEADKLEAGGRKLIADEYKNLKGLTRYGRSNGLCPYTPYEDLAENSIRLARKVTELANKGGKYETFYYFYNNELVYEYNKFCELSKVGLLKSINQLNLVAFKRESNGYPPRINRVTEKDSLPDLSQRPAQPGKPTAVTQQKLAHPAEPVVHLQHDTVFVERVDTVFIERNTDGKNFYSLEGFAPNNMVLLLDVSASMKAPHKMPLLKKSVKTLLQLLRPEDKVSIIVYSGKAKVILEAASGSETQKIAQAIDELDSDGSTDGTAGIRLAYKVANRHYIRAGNNRIILATDGEFPVNNELYNLATANAQEDVYLSVFHFTPRSTPNTPLWQLSQKGRGSYEHITPQNANYKLVSEAKAKKIMD